MPHFARKPVTVEAVQWHDGDDPVYDLRGNLIDVQSGDWVLTDTVTGEKEPISDSWFQANYDPTDTPNTVPAPPETAVSTSAVNTPGVQPPPPPPPAASPTSQSDPRDAEIAALRAQLADARSSSSPTVPAGTAPTTGTDTGVPQTGPGGLTPSDSGPSGAGATGP